MRAEFKNRLKEAMEKINISQAELATKTGITASSISDWLKGKYLAKQDKVGILAKALRVSPAWLMGFDDPKPNIYELDNIFPIETRRYPLLGDIACGQPIQAIEEVNTYIEAESTIKADFCLRAKGDSMIDARILNGDIVFVREQPDVETGEIAVVLIDNEATLKKVYKYPDKLVLMAANTSYSPMVYMPEELENVRILGKAVAFQSLVR